ncbi:type IV toxin-antitoxin system AbiEi family antitoxin domain-containing protein [Agromyces lapidis]|uniref:Type IV toxin-antitoxin system AbiEi family antitoxin domain-containing protein n=1 Tax=Agromyces lapidis TaxID=279574 RepID=A0ABV5SU62_9MICO|nr:type IV toxin-antitoxin system AbiEi family antitoxin domain-containing protein [Agromyces lapidis]
MPVSAIRVRRLCTELSGVARTSELAELGVDAYSLRLAVDAGEVVRLREGVYGVADLPAEVQTAVRHGGRLGCLSRLGIDGVWLLEQPASVHVAMMRTGRRRFHSECRCITHWSDSRLAGPAVALDEALVQVLGCRGEEEFFVALESAMRKRLITRSGIERIRSRVPKVHRGLVGFARWDADSGLESLLRLRLRAHGLALASQIDIPGIGRVDFVLGDRLILEVDGKQNHVDGFDSLIGTEHARAAAASKRHKDLVRDAVAAAYGFETLRFDYALVVHDWPLVEAAILAKVDRGLHLRSRVAGRGR